VLREFHRRLAAPDAILKRTPSRVLRQISKAKRTAEIVSFGRINSLVAHFDAQSQIVLVAEVTRIVLHDVAAFGIGAEALWRTANDRARHADLRLYAQNADAVIGGAPQSQQLDRARRLALATSKPLLR